MSIEPRSDAPRSDRPKEVVEIFYEQEAAEKFCKEGDQIKALFNPSQLRYEREIDWRVDSRTLAEFGKDKPKTLTIDLFFDTYEGPPNDGGEPFASLVVAPTARGVDVSKFTNQVARLALVDPKLNKGRPPRCKLTWGRFLLIEGVLTRFVETFSFFLLNGTPVRAVLSCTFVQAAHADNAKENPPTQTEERRSVREGDTVTGIAQEAYGDPRRWREIAAANGIDDPRRPPVDGLLTIPRRR